MVDSLVVQGSLDTQNNSTFSDKQFTDVFERNMC
jgi:hypothetical protein